MKLAALLILLSTLGYRTFAQATVGALVETMYDDNVYNNYQQTASPVTAFTLQGGYLWDSPASSVALSYTGAMNYFSTVSARTFHTHDATLSYAAPLDEEDQTSFNAGVAYSLRVNREDLSIYDHGQLSLHGVLEHRFSETIVAKAGYTFRSVRFAELADFDYLEHYAFAQVTALLPTSSTLILEADLGSKGYLTPNPVAAAESGQRGKRQSGNAAEGPTATQLIGMARIGQPIVPGTGLSVTLQYQANMQKESRYIVFSDGAYSDDDFLDDHYGYEGPAGTLMLTQLIPGDARLRLSYSLHERTYGNRPAYDLAGVLVADVRRDTRRSLSVQLAKSFEALGCTLGLSFDHIVNGSNDPYYDYKNNALSVMVSIGY